IRRRILPRRPLTPAPGSRARPTPRRASTNRFQQPSKTRRATAASRFRFPCPLQQTGSGSGKPIRNSALSLIRKRDPAQWRAMIAIERCRTVALGGHVERCGDCGHQRIAYNSCRNRNSPKCQGLERAQWLEARQAELLDVPYYHVVFTVPDVIATIAFQNQTVVYDILFRAASETLRTIAADPKHLGAEVGFLAVLHTWGQNLMHHPHLHCLIPGGGISLDGGRWIACRPGFFLPVRVLSRLFRGLFLHYLENAFAAGELNFFSAQRHLHEPAAFRRYLAPVHNTEWVVYAKRPFAGPAQVLDYVGRYTHRVAISNNRLVSMDGDRLRFRWKDYRDGNRQKTMTLAAGEFIRRFLIHVLPDGF